MSPRLAASTLSEHCISAQRIWAHDFSHAIEELLPHSTA